MHLPATNLLDAALHRLRPSFFVCRRLTAMGGRQDTIHELAHDVVRQRARFLHDLIEGKRHADHTLARAPHLATPGCVAAAMAETSPRGMKRTEAIILSMTQERQKPDILNGSRRMRIANDSGVKVVEVNQLLKILGRVRGVGRLSSGARWRAHFGADRATGYPPGILSEGPIERCR